METIYFIYKFDEIEELAIYLVKGLFFLFSKHFLQALLFP